MYLIISDILIHLFMELSSSHILSYKTCYFFPVRIARTFIWVYFLVAQWVKNQPPVQETRVQSLGWEDPLEMEMATHSSILAWRIPWTEEPGGLWSTGSQRVIQERLKLWLSSFKNTFTILLFLEICLPALILACTCISGGSQKWLQNTDCT